MSTLTLFFLNLCATEVHLEKIQYKKCILCGYPENRIEHVVNDCKKLCRERRKTLEELNKIDNTNYKKLLKAIEYHYYSKKFTNGKQEKKSDKKGVKIIKEFLLEMYKKFGAE